MKKQQLTFLLLLCTIIGLSQQPSTYCNPVNIDYGYSPIPNFSEWGRHRSTADPVITLYKGDYYLFTTNQTGYWWSRDMLEWNFISRSFLKPYHKVYDDLCAPAVWVQGDTLLVFGSTYTSSFPIWMSTDPKANVWKEAIDSFDMGGWDPAFFVDDDKRLYMYNGSSNRYPIYGIEVNRSTFEPRGYRRELYLLEPQKYGWQRFGEYLDNTFLDPFIEGAWMNKHKKKYYLQYGAPGTEFSGYAEGVLVGDHPLGPFTPQAHNPFAYKPGGFARGAGHGNTFQDKWGNWWHTGTTVVSVKNVFERRISFWPAGFDNDGVMYTNTSFGDYPHYIDNAPSDHLRSRWTGWMLLNYNKPVTVSSTLGSYHANNAVDENIKTYWSAATAGSNEWLQSDLGDLSTVHALQVNYADQDAAFLGKSAGVSHKYRIRHSTDGKTWKVLIDKSGNNKDVPHDYVELSNPVRTRFLRLENIAMPTGKFAISGFRVFGKGSGNQPDTVKNFISLRTEGDKRSTWLKWQPVDNAFAYNIYFGIAPDKLYSCIMVHNSNEYYFKGMDKNRTYYFQIEAVNENGVSVKTAVLKSE